MLQVIPGFGFYADRRGIHDPDGKGDERFGRLSGTERISLRPIQPEQTVLRIDTRRNHLPGLLETRLRFTEPVNVQISVSQIAQRFRRFPHMGMINGEYAQAIAIPPVQIKMPAVFPHETGMIDHVRETVFHPVQALFGRRPHIILQTVGSAFANAPETERPCRRPPERARPRRPVRQPAPSRCEADAVATAPATGHNKISADKYPTYRKKTKRPATPVSRPGSDRGKRPGTGFSEKGQQESAREQQADRALLASHTNKLVERPVIVPCDHPGTETEDSPQNIRSEHPYSAKRGADTRCP